MNERGEVSFDFPLPLPRQLSTAWHDREDGCVDWKPFAF